MCVIEYTSVLTNVSARISTVAIRCIMHVWHVCRILMISDIPLMNAEVSAEFRGSVGGSSFKVRGRESDGEGRGKGEPRDIQREDEIRETQTVRITYRRIDKDKKKGKTDCYSRGSST